MKIFPVLGVSLIQLCTSSLGDRNEDKRGLIDMMNSASAGPSSAGLANPSESTIMSEAGNFLAETPMTLGNNVSFEDDEDSEAVNFPPSLINDEDERDLYQMIEEDVEVPVIEHDQEEPNENILPTFSGYVEEDRRWNEIITSLFRPMILPYTPPEHPSFDPSMPVFPSTPFPYPESNEGTGYENPVVSSAGNGKDYYNSCEDRSSTRYMNKINHRASISTGKPKWTLNRADSETSRKHDEEEIGVPKKRRLELLAYRGDEDSASRSDGDEKAESRTRKRSKTTLNSNFAGDDREQYISFKALEAMKKRLEEDIRRCASYEEWIEEQRREARKKNETVDEIDILLRVLEGLGLVKGESPSKRATKRALSTSLSTKETESQEGEKSHNDASTNFHSGDSLYLVKSVVKHGCKQKMILRRDLVRASSSEMRIHFGTKIFFSIFESRIPSPNNNVFDYQSIRKGFEDKILPIESLARKKYAYLRNALIEAGIKVIEAKVGSMHTLYLGNNDSGDTLELSNIVKRAGFFEQATEDLIKFTGVRRVFYTIHRRDLCIPVKDCTQQGISEYRRKIGNRWKHHKRIAVWLEKLQDKHDAEGGGNKVIYLLVVKEGTNTIHVTTEEECQSLLVVYQIIDENSSLSARSRNNLMNSILGVQ